MARLIILLLMLARPLAAEPVVIFAAASLKSPLDEIFDGTDVVLSYGGSGSMAQQIARGAPADIFLSANVDWMDWLEGEGFVAPDSRVDLLGNRLVLVNFTVAGEVAPQILLGAGDFSVAIGQRASVPAGQYAVAAMATLGVLEDVERRLIELPSVAAVARLVQLREVDFGIVYETDAWGGRLPIVGRFPDESHPPIVYPMAVTSEGHPQTEEVWRHLQSDAALDVFADHGFVVLP